MITKATHPGTCKLCGQPFNVGDAVESHKGRASAHAECSNRGTGARGDHGPSKYPLFGTPETCCEGTRMTEISP